MQPIRSGTTTERIVRGTLLAVLISGFAAAFLWDGYIRYARQNAEALVESLGLSAEAVPDIDSALTADEAQRLIHDLAAGADTAEVQALLGDPALTHGDDTYYIGPGGHLRVRWDQHRLASADWVDGLHSDTDLSMQRWFGYVLGVLGLFYLVNFIRAVTYRLRLTDDGLKLPGKALIPFAAMTSLRPERSGKSSRVELGYSLDGRDRFVRLDDYIIREFRAVVAAICEQKGFADPFKPDK